MLMHLYQSFFKMDLLNTTNSIDSFSWYGLLYFIDTRLTSLWHRSHLFGSPETCWTGFPRCPQWCIFYSWDCTVGRSVSDIREWWTNKKKEHPLIWVSSNNYLSSASPSPYFFVALKMLSMTLSAGTNHRKKKRIRGQLRLHHVVT